MSPNIPPEGCGCPSIEAVVEGRSGLRWGESVLMSEELVVLAKRLISFETCEPDAISEAAGFVQGWLEARGIETRADEVRDLPVVMAEVGPEGAPTVVLHGHIDVVPAPAGQFEPKVEGDKLYGRG